MLETKIDKLIEEGVAAIEEAVHRNHPHLNKEWAQRMGQQGTLFDQDVKAIQKNRSELAAAIRKSRARRDSFRDTQKKTEDTPYVYEGNRAKLAGSQPFLKREAAWSDNNARAISQSGEKRGGDRAALQTSELGYLNDVSKRIKRAGEAPRIVKSNKK